MSEQWYVESMDSIGPDRATVYALADIAELLEALLESHRERNALLREQMAITREGVAVRKRFADMAKESE